MQRNFVHFIAAALILPAVFLGSFAKPASADVLGLVSLINNYRQDNGLSALYEDQKLTNAACWLSNDMSSKNYFSHTDSLSRDMEERLSVFGVSGGYRAENIANLVNQPNSAEKIFTMWKKSSFHNTNMLSKSFSRIGVSSSYRVENKTYYWVADFASGSVTNLTSICKTTIKQPSSTSKPQKPNTKPQIISPKSKVEIQKDVIQIATVAPQVESIIDQASKSATPSSRLVKFGNINNNRRTPLVRFLGLGGFLIGNILVFCFILFSRKRGLLGRK